MANGTGNQLSARMAGWGFGPEFIGCASSVLSKGCISFPYSIMR